MLSHFFTDPIQLVSAQAAVTVIMALMMLSLARWAGIHLEKEIIIAMARGLVQILGVGAILLLIFDGTIAVGFVVLAAMMVLAAKTAEKRARGLPGAYKVGLYGIILGSGTIILLMTWIGVIDTKLTAMIPLGSMIIANSMSATSLALDRFQGDVRSHRGDIETALALGASPRTAVHPYVKSAVRASLIPRIDSLRSLGIVWIPGVMAGMLLAGSQPIHAAFYQFVVMTMLLTVGGVTSLFSTLFMAGNIFTTAEQLALGKPTSNAPRKKGEKIK